MNGGRCLCLCAMAHPEQEGICHAYAPVTSITKNSPTLGLVKIPLCRPCALAQGVSLSKPVSDTT